MPDRWVIDDDHPQGHSVPMNKKETKQHERDRKEAATQEQRDAAIETCLRELF